MKKFLQLFVLTVGVLLLALVGLDCLYSYAIAKHPLLRIPENKTYDYLVIGDSRVSSLLEGPMSDMTGKRVLVLPHYGGNLEDILAVTDYFFERGNRVHTVISTVDLRIAQTAPAKHDWQYYAHNVVAQHYLLPRIPFAIYARNNRKIPLRKVLEEFKKPLDTSRKETRDMGLFQKYEPHADQMNAYDTTNLRLDIILSLREKLRKQGVMDHRLLVAPLSPEYARYHPGAESYKVVMRKEGFRLYDCSVLYTDTTAFADLVHLKRNKYLDFSRKLADSLIQDNAHINLSAPQTHSRTTDHR